MEIKDNILVKVLDEDIINGTFVIPDKVTEIGENAFNGCKNLKNIMVPSNIKRIGFGAFENCYSLENISLPDNIITISNNCFKNCISLKNLSISKYIEWIHFSAFENCRLLEYLDISNTIQYIGHSAFNNCKNLFLNINTCFFEITSGYDYFNYFDVKSLTINDISINLDNIQKEINFLRKHELREILELELIKNNLFDKKYLNDFEHTEKIIKTVLDMETFRRDRVLSELDEFKRYVRLYIENHKEEILNLRTLKDIPMNEVLEYLNNYNVLPFQLNETKDIVNYGNDLLEYSCYITDVYHETISKYNNDIFAHKIEKLLMKINIRKFLLIPYKMDSESIKYLNYFSEYKINQNNEESEILETLREICKIYIKKLNEHLNNLLNHNCKNDNLDILSQSDNNTNEQVLNDKINSLKNNMAVIIEYYKRINLIVESNNIYNQRLNVVNHQLNRTKRLKNDIIEVKIEQEQVDNFNLTLNEIITVDKEKSNKVEIKNNTIENLDNEINKITNNEKTLIKK